MFRKPSKKELKVILSALRAFGSTDFLKDNELLLLDIVIGEDGSRKIVDKDAKGRIREVYALSKDLVKFLELYKLNFVHAGLKVGEVGSRRFRFSLEGSFYLAKKDKKRVYVNEKGEMLFLYGRDVFAESVLRVTSDVEENDIVFVCNRKGDILGIGKARFDAKRMKDAGSRVVVENLVDRGEYLRKEKTYSSY
jgi:60S ribosome subunit biogenesis protein NIP7